MKAKSKEDYINFEASTVHRIYIGIPPTPGECNSDKYVGDADKDFFKISADGWTDSDGISEYNFFFSFDGGDIYIPI